MGEAPTCTEGNVVWLDVLEDLGSLVLRSNVLDAGDEDIELARLAGAETLDGRDLVLSADDAGDGPGTLEEERGQQLGDLAVATDEKDVVRHCEGDGNGDDNGRWLMNQLSYRLGVYKGEWVQVVFKLHHIIGGLPVHDAIPQLRMQQKCKTSGRQRLRAACDLSPWSTPCRGP